MLYMWGTIIVISSIRLFENFIVIRENPVFTKYFYFFRGKKRMKNQFNTDVFSVFVFLHAETTNALYNINKMPNNPAFICEKCYCTICVYFVYVLQGVENERRPDNINGNEYNRNKIEGDTLGRQKFFLCNQTLATTNEDFGRSGGMNL